MNEPLGCPEGRQPMRRAWGSLAGKLWADPPKQSTAGWQGWLFSTLPAVSQFTPLHGRAA